MPKDKKKEDDLVETFKKFRNKFRFAQAGSGVLSDAEKRKKREKAERERRKRRPARP